MTQSQGSHCDSPATEEGLGLSVLVRFKAEMQRIYFEDIKELPLAICKAILKAKELLKTAKESMNTGGLFSQEPEVVIE